MSKEENIILPVIGLGAVLLLFSGGSNKNLPPAPGPGSSLTPTDFVKQYWPIAVYAEDKTGIPALFTITQAGLESAWGKSAPGYNYFGVKADSSWHGEVQNLATTEYVNGKYVHVVLPFRAYPGPIESFIDHGNFFLQNSRYAPALDYLDHPYIFAAMIAKEGYATAPNYGQILTDSMSLVEGIAQRNGLI